MERFPVRYLPNRLIFGRLHISAIGLFYASSNDRDTERYHWISEEEEVSLCIVGDKFLKISRTIGHLLGENPFICASPYIKCLSGKFFICITMHVARNPWGEWRFKSAKCFHPPISTVLSTPTMLPFRIHIRIINMLIKDASATQ